MAEVEQKQEEQPEKLEKSDEVPKASEDVELDSTAIPSGSLATDTVDLDSSDTPSASATASPATGDAAPAEEQPEVYICRRAHDRHTCQSQRTCMKDTEALAHPLLREGQRHP